MHICNLHYTDWVKINTIYLCILMHRDTPSNDTPIDSLVHLSHDYFSFWRKNCLTYHDN